MHFQSIISRCYKTHVRDITVFTTPNTIRFSIPLYETVGKVIAISQKEGLFQVVLETPGPRKRPECLGIPSEDPHIPTRTSTAYMT